MTLAVITGGTGALGVSVANAFERSGYRVIVTTTHETERTRYEGSAEAFVIDLRDLGAVRGLAAKFDRVDALVLAAGGFSMVPLERMSAADLDSMVDMNFR